MIIGVTKEIKADEYRVGITPAGVKALTDHGHKVLVDDLCGEPLGYRCADCRHPDCHGNDSSEGFQWHSLKEVQSAGVITWPDGMETVEHRCMVCFPDGKMIPVIVEGSHPGSLSEKERRFVLERERATHGILISQSDSGIRTLACRNWKRVKKYVLQPSSSILE